MASDIFAPHQHPRALPKDKFIALLRVGNADGQGGMIMVEDRPSA